MAYIDYKVSIWRRVNVKESIADDAKALERLIQEIKSALCINNTIENMIVINEDEILLDTEEWLHPSDNDGQSTVELYDNEGNVIATNESIEIEIIKSPLE